MNSQVAPWTTGADGSRIVDACGPALAGHARIRIDAAHPGWQPSGLRLARGDALTLLAAGEVWLSREADVVLGPHVALWWRIGDGPAQRAEGGAFTLRADRDGELELVAKPPGEWADASGRFDPGLPRELMGASGELQVLALAWRGDPEPGLVLAAAVDASGRAAQALADWREPLALPAGWEPLWRLGRSRVFSRRPAVAGEPATIGCHCDSDVEILVHPVDLPLDESLRFSWSWCVDQLPGPRAEDSLPTHDYLSVALAFDNGQDLTWMWSRELPTGHHFRCPLPWWDQRETHLVVRSGTGELGRWLDEERPVLEDYRRCVGGEPPARVTGIWLIAVSAFRRGVGEAGFRALQLRGRAGTVVASI